LNRRGNAKLVEKKARVENGKSQRASSDGLDGVCAADWYERLNCGNAGGKRPSNGDNPRRDGKMDGGFTAPVALPMLKARRISVQRLIFRRESCR
jgi:hypothetical protein